MKIEKCFLFALLIIFTIIPAYASGGNFPTLPGAFGNMEVEALDRIDGMDVSESKKTRMRQEVRHELKQAAREHQAAVETIKQAQAYVDAGGIAPDSFKKGLGAAGNLLGNIGDAALVSDTMSQLDSLGKNPYLPEEAKGTARALTAVGAVMQKVGDKLNKIAPGIGDAFSVYGQTAQKLADVTGGVAKARVEQGQGYFDNIRGNSPEGRLMKTKGVKGTDALARELDLWGNGVQVIRADFGRGADKYFLKVGDTYKEVNIDDLRKVVGDWKITHDRKYPDSKILNTLLNGGRVRDGYATHDREDLDWSARFKVEERKQDNFIRDAIGESKFGEMTRAEKWDFRNELYSLKTDIRDTGAVVDDDRLAKLFNNVVMQGNRDRVLKNLVYEQNRAEYDKIFKQKGIGVNDIQNTGELNELRNEPKPVTVKPARPEKTGGGSGFNYFEKLKNRPETKGTEPQKRVDPSNNPDPELRKQRMELKKKLGDFIKDLQGKTAEIPEEREEKKAQLAEKKEARLEGIEEYRRIKIDQAKEKARFRQFFKNEKASASGGEFIDLSRTGDLKKVHCFAKRIEDESGLRWKVWIFESYGGDGEGRIEPEDISIGGLSDSEYQKFKNNPHNTYISLGDRYFMENNKFSKNGEPFKTSLAKDKYLEKDIKAINGQASSARDEAIELYDHEAVEKLERDMDGKEWTYKKALNDMEQRLSTLDGKSGPSDFGMMDTLFSKDKWDDKDAATKYEEIIKDCRTIEPRLQEVLGPYSYPEWFDEPDDSERIFGKPDIMQETRPPGVDIPAADRQGQQPQQPQHFQP